MTTGTRAREASVAPRNPTVAMTPMSNMIDAVSTKTHPRRDARRTSARAEVRRPRTEVPIPTCASRPGLQIAAVKARSHTGRAPRARLILPTQRRTPSFAPFLVQLRLRLRLVPIGPRRDVLQLCLEQVVQELRLCVLHPRENLAGGRRADAIDRVRVHGPLPVDGHEVRDLLRPGEELPFLVREVELPRPLRIGVSHRPRGPSEDRQKSRLAFRTFRMVGHRADPDLLVEVPALETKEVNRLRGQVEAHPVQDLPPLRFRREELRRLDVPPEDRIREGRRRLLGSADDDLDLTSTNLLHDLAHAREVRVEQERLPHRLVVDRRVREADLERPQVALADREPAADRAESLRNRLHVIPEGQVVLEQRLQATLQGLVVDPQQVVREALDVEFAGVRHELVQDPVRVRPPEPDEVLTREQFLDQVAQGDVDDLAERRMDDQEAVERLDENPVVRRHGRAGLAMVRVLLAEPLGARLVDRPCRLEVLDRLRDAVSFQSRVDLLPDAPDALREAERHREHLAVSAGDHRVRIRHRGDVDHAVLPNPLDLPGPPADDEVQALAGLDHHELLAEDAHLPLRRQVEDRVAALVADRREVLEVVAAAFRGDADPLALVPDDAEVGEEFSDSLGRDILEFPVRIRRADRREDLRPRCRATLVQGAAYDLVGEDIEGETMDVQRLEVLLLRGLDRGEGLDGIVR